MTAKAHKDATLGKEETPTEDPAEHPDNGLRSGAGGGGGADLRATDARGHARGGAGAPRPPRPRPRSEAFQRTVSCFLFLMRRHTTSRKLLCLDARARGGGIKGDRARSMRVGCARGRRARATPAADNRARAQYSHGKEKTPTNDTTSGKTLLFLSCPPAFFFVTQFSPTL